MTVQKPPPGYIDYMEERYWMITCQASFYFHSYALTPTSQPTKAKYSFRPEKDGKR